MFVTKYIQYITPVSMIFLHGVRLLKVTTGGKKVNKFSIVVGRVLNFTQKLIGQGRK